MFVVSYIDFIHNLPRSGVINEASQPDKTGQVKTSKSKFPPKICHIDSIYGSKALETAFYFMQLLRRP